MRLLIVTREHHGDHAYGLGKAMRRIADGLKLRGHEVVYCSAMDWQPADNAEFVKMRDRLNKFFHTVGINTELAPAWAERIIQGKLAGARALDMSATHVWFQDPWLAIACRWSLRLKGHIRDGFHWGISEHGLGSFAQAVGYDGLKLNSRSLKLMLRLEQSVLQQAGWVWAPSQTALDQLCRDLGMNQQPPHWDTLGYGVPEPIPMKRKEARAALGWDESTFYVLAVGRISPVKHMHQLVDACAQVKTRLNTRLELVILGQGDLTAVEQSIQNTGFNPKILFAEDVTPYLAAADVYVSASQAESFGLANQEAIAAGLPCVLACGGATCEVAGMGAWVIDGSTQSFAQALNDLLDDGHLLEFWKKRAETQRNLWPHWSEIVDECEKRLLAIAK